MQEQLSRENKRRFREDRLAAHSRIEEGSLLAILQVVRVQPCGRLSSCRDREMGVQVRADQRPRCPRKLRGTAIEQCETGPPLDGGCVRRSDEGSNLTRAAYDPFLQGPFASVAYCFAHRRRRKCKA